MSIFIGTDKVGFQRVNQASVNREVLVLNSTNDIPMIQMYSPCNENMVLATDIYFGKSGTNFQIRHKDLNYYHPTFEINKSSNTTYVNAIFLGSNVTVNNNLSAKHFSASDGQFSNINIDIPDRTPSTMDNNAFAIRSNNVPFVAFKNNGFVGIGLNAPQANLHVASNIICTSNVTARYSLTTCNIYAMDDNLFVKSKYMQFDANNILINGAARFTTRINFEAISLLSNLQVPTLSIDNKTIHNLPTVEVIYEPRSFNNEYNTSNQLILARTMYSNAVVDVDADGNANTTYTTTFNTALSLDTKGRLSLGSTSTDALFHIESTPSNQNFFKSYVNITDVYANQILTLDSNGFMAIGPLLTSDAMLTVQDNVNAKCKSVFRLVQSNNTPFFKFGQSTTQGINYVTQCASNGSIQINGYFDSSNQYALAVNGTSFMDTLRTSNLAGIGASNTVFLNNTSMEGAFRIQSSNIYCQEIECAQTKSSNAYIAYAQASNVSVLGYASFRTDGIMQMPSNLALDGKVNIRVENFDSYRKIGRGIVVSGTQDTSVLVNSVGKSAMVEVSSDATAALYGLYGIDASGNLFIKHRLFTGADAIQEQLYVLCTKPTETTPSKMTLYNAMSIGGNKIGVGVDPLLMDTSLVLQVEGNCKFNNVLSVNSLIANSVTTSKTFTCMNTSQTIPTMTVDTATGCIGIGTSNPRYKVHIAGGDLYCENDIFALSDAAVKRNISPIGNALDMVTCMRGVQYNKIGHEATYLGVIAQEIEKVCPSIVNQNGTYKSVAYMQIIPVLIEAIKDLKKLIISQKHE